MENNCDFEITLPRTDQIYNYSCSFKECDTTDFAILSGIDYPNIYASNKDIYGCWWTSTYCNGGAYVLVNPNYYPGSFYSAPGCNRTVGIRPYLKCDDLSKLPLKTLHDCQGVMEVEFGEYPQNAVDADLAKILDNELLLKRLEKTGKTYTTDSEKWTNSRNCFNPVKNKEYIYNGKKYVRVKANCSTIFDIELSNGITVKRGDYVWVEVSPIVWYVDKKYNQLISKNILVSGVRVCGYGDRYSYFEKSEMYQFLNRVFAKDIIPIEMSDIKNDKPKQYRKKAKNSNA